MVSVIFGYMIRRLSGAFHWKQSNSQWTVEQRWIFFLKQLTQNNLVDLQLYSYIKCAEFV